MRVKRWDQAPVILMSRGGAGGAGSPGRAGGGGTVHKTVARDVLAQIGELPPEVAAVLVLR